MFRLTMPTMVALTLAACGSDGQTLTGRVQTSTFPEALTEVRAVGTHEVVHGNVAPDGSFSITLPEGDSYRIEMVSNLRVSPLVYPRTTGAVDTDVTIVGSGEFDLGGVHYAQDVGDVTGDAALADHAPPSQLGDTGQGGGQDGTGGGSGPGDTGGGGGGDTGGGGGGDTGGGGGGG